MQQQQYGLWDDSLTSIWNDLQPNRWSKSISDTYPSLICVALFTIFHYFLDKILSSKSRSFAEQSIASKQHSKKLLPRPLYITDAFDSDLLAIHSTKQLTGHGNKLLTTLLSTYKVSNTAKHKEEVLLYHRQQCSIGKHVSKFNEATFKVVCFGFVYLYDILILIDPIVSNFFWHQTEVICAPNSYPQSSYSQENSLINLDLWYWIQMGYHGHRALYQFFEYNRSDWLAMFIHHWVTIALLLGSYCAGLQQTGATVLLINDHMDMLLPAGKMCEYLGWMKMRAFFWVLFAGLWIPLRIVMFFLKMLYPYYFGCAYYVIIRNYSAQWFMIFGLTVIYVLQYYWGAMIMKMLYHNVVKKELVDVRSGEETDGTSKKKNK